MDTSTPIRSAKGSLSFDFSRIGSTENSMDLSPIKKADGSIVPESPVRESQQVSSRPNISVSIVEESEPEDNDGDRTRDRSSILEEPFIKNPILQRVLTSTPNTKKDLVNRANRQRVSNASSKSVRSSRNDSSGSVSNPITLDSSDDELPPKKTVFAANNSSQDLLSDDESKVRQNVGSSDADVLLQSDASRDIFDIPESQGEDDVPVRIDSTDSDVDIADGSAEIVPEPKGRNVSHQRKLNLTDSEDDIAEIDESKEIVDISDSEIPVSNRRRINLSDSEDDIEDVDASKDIVTISESEGEDVTKHRKVDSFVSIDEADDSRQTISSASDKDYNIDSSAILSESSDNENVSPKKYDFTEEEKRSLVNYSRDQLEGDLSRFKNMDLTLLPDKGEKIKRRMALMKNRLGTMVEEVQVLKVKKPSIDCVVLDQYLNEGKRMFGGAMTAARQDTISKVTDEALQRIHVSITDAPDNVPTETPEGINIELMNHQKSGLTWMLFRESKTPRGGILADDMGLGKTLSMISLIVAQKNLRKSSDEEKQKRQAEMLKFFQNDPGVMPAFCTLVIAPASLIYQWEKEIKDRTVSKKLSVYVFHGPKRETDPRALSRFDVILTTYNIVSSELGESAAVESDDDDSDGAFGRVKNKVKQKKHISKKNNSVLTKIGWQRIILDEAHNIKNRQSLASKGCCRIPAFSRWALTGTPIHNNLWDLFSLVRFLRVYPFGEEKMWKEFIIQSGKAGAARINALVKSLLLRRTKTEMCALTKQPLVNLKPRSFEVVKVELKNLEYNIYQQMFEASKQKAKQLIEIHGDMPTRRQRKPGQVVKNPFIGGAREVNLDDKFQGMNAILMLLLRLRQACVHLSLTRAAVDLDAFKFEGMDDSAVMEDLEKTFGNISISDQDYVIDEDGKKCTVETVFLPSYKSAKVRALFERLEKVFEAKDKCVIVSQWTTMLDIIEQQLKKKKVSYTAITGQVATKDRQERVNSFNRTDGGAQVMLLSLTAGGVGLNLVGGNHLFLVDLHWNPALEMQACDRIYRVGQTKNVFIHKFITEGTIEQRVLELQEQKKELARGVLEGSAKIPTKLSMNDLKHLFDLDSRPAPRPAKDYAGPANVRRLP